MKKFTLVSFIFVILFTKSNGAYADEPQKTKPIGSPWSISFGADRLSWNFEGNKIMVPSWNARVDYRIKKHFGIGFEYRREGNLKGEGYYLGSYGSYRSNKLADKVYLLADSGIEFGIPSTIYNFYETKNVNGSILRQWVFINQPMIKSVGIYPFTTVGLGVTVNRHLFLEGGVKMQIMKIGVQKAIFAPDFSAISVKDSKKRQIVPSITLSIGYRF